MSKLITPIVYDVEASNRLEDPAWDDFVARTPGGHHAQTSMWARLKASLGWKVARLVVRRGDRITGGAQILIRNVALAGSLGYVTKGPLFFEADAALEDFTMNQIHRACREQHIRYLAIQPPNNRHDLAARMSAWDFEKCLVSFTPAPYATLVIDLQHDLKDILACMRSTTRYNVRLAERKGVTVREGTQRDIGVFYQTLLATSGRKNISEYRQEYWERFYDIFGRSGYATILIAEFEGQALGSVLLVNFGETVIYKKGGWMGMHKNLHANDLLQWAAVQWSKRKGYRYYDFEGIFPEAAKAIQREGDVPSAYEGTVTSFKFGFGGEVVFYPGAFDHFYHPVFGWAYQNIFEKVRYRPDVNAWINRFIRS